MEASILDSSFVGYPCGKKGTHALHFRATIGIRSRVPFSVVHYTKDLSGWFVVPGQIPKTDFDDMRLWAEPEVSLKGYVVCAGVHGSTRVWRDRLRPGLARVEVSILIQLCHPTEEPTLVAAQIPLWVHQPTGPLADRM